MRTGAVVISLRGHGLLRVEGRLSGVLQVDGQPRLCQQRLLRVGSGDVAKVSHHQRGHRIHRRFPVMRVVYRLPSFEGNFPPPFPVHYCQRITQVCEFKYVTDVCVVCRRCVLYQMPRHSRKNAPSLAHDLYLLVLLRTSAMGNGLLTSFFSFFVQDVRLASPSSLLPAEPFSKGLVLYVCFAHLRYVCVEVITNFWSVVYFLF